VAVAPSAASRDPAVSGRLRRDGVTGLYCDPMPAAEARSWRVLRATSVAVAGSLTIAALALVGTAIPAAAGDRVDRAGAALRTNPLYLAPGAERLISPAQAAGISNRLGRAATPIFIAVLPVMAVKETGDDPGRLPGALYLANGQQAGTYAVWAGKSFRAGSTELGTIADQIAQDAKAASGGDRAEAILRFVEAVELELWQPPPPGSTVTTETHERSGGFPYAWLFALLGVLLIGVAGWARARIVRAEQQEFDVSRELLDHDLRTLDDEVQHAEATLTGPDLDAVLRADYARALGGLAQAKQKATALGGPEDVVEFAHTLDEIRYALACARARSEDRPLPIRPACLFDPLHPAPEREVLWTPDGAEPRLVPACADDADRLRAGAAPQARTVKDLDLRLPYWAAGASCRAWALGWYRTGYDSEQLYALFAGTPLGAALDDPAEPTQESPLDGWTEPEPGAAALPTQPDQRSTGVSR